MKQARRNPFQAFAKFKGRAARLRAWEGGFHTALKKDLVIPYAQMKWDNDPDDMPVILTFDMTGLTRFADIDSRRAADFFYEEVARAEFRRTEDDTGWFFQGEEVDSDQVLEQLTWEQENRDPVEGEMPDSGDDALNAMWSLSGSPSVRENAVHLALSYIRGSSWKLEDMYMLGRKLAKDERAKLSPEEEELLIEAFGQCRYMADIPDARLIKVEYMAPFFAQVIDPDGGDDDDTIKEATEAGYAFVETDRSELDEYRTKAWARAHSELPLLEATVGRSRTSRSWEQQRIEYHGTSLKNLLMAAPWLTAELLDPPPPCMSTIEEVYETLEAEGAVPTLEEDEDGDLVGDAEDGEKEREDDPTLF